MIETALQLWSSSYKPHYQHCGGALTYLYDHLPYKVVDMLGIGTYVIFLLCFWRDTSAQMRYALTIGHLTQVLQIYRLTHRQFRLMVCTVQYKFGFIFSILLFTISIFLLLSRCMYFLEKERNHKIVNIFDATWLVFVTILSIG